MQQLTSIQDTSTASTIQNFAARLSNLRFSALLLLPTHFTSSPGVPGCQCPSIASLSPSIWSDIFTTHLLAPFATLQAFLPLLKSHKSSLIFLTPSIIPSLTPALNAPESVVAGAMQNYISTLRRETTPEINVVQFKLGAFNYGKVGNDTFWGDALARMKYASEINAVSDERGTSPRELHNEVFDAILEGDRRRRRRRGVVFVGRGSRTYDLLGRLMPEGVVSWMLNLKMRREANDASSEQGTRGKELVKRAGEEVYD